MEDFEIEITKSKLKIPITTCIHMIRMSPETDRPTSIGSGVIIKYREKFFICTVAHFTHYPDHTIGIVSGRISENRTEIIELESFSYVYSMNFEGVDINEMETEDFIYCIENLDKSGAVPIDIAFKEIPLLNNIIQAQRVFNLDEVGELLIEEDGKSFALINDEYEIDKDQLCSFYGRIRPDFKDDIFKFEEALYWGLPIKSIGDSFFEMDLGAPISDHSRFEGCSGAPIIDSRGRLIGLLTHGPKDTSKSSIYGYRFDKLKRWIDLTYFQDPS